MDIQGPAEQRDIKLVELNCDVAVVGGGLSGVCAALAAARAGSKVVLIQDRPVLGGNASSEIRMWAVGATSHMGNNNRWAREGGIVDELLVENVYRNTEGNSLIFDTILLEKIVEEPNVELLLNTSVFEVQKSTPETIDSVKGFCGQNSTFYQVQASHFIDASGDGIVGFQAGAAFRMGAEGKDEFDEGFAPSHEYGELLGHTLYFYSKDSGHPVRFTPPSFALKDITKIPRWRNFKVGMEGCQLWWIEYGGRFDTIHDTEKIKWELWSIVYGVWDHIKNSGNFSDTENLVLEWVGTIPGKRESRRFEGDYMLSQKDIVEQRHHEDAISYGGWAIDLHPADGIYSEAPGCNQWHSKGVYQIPYRCLYSRNISNLFLTGRLISATHVAFGSTRVMLTCAQNGQVVGTAASICAKRNLQASDLLEPSEMNQLRLQLDRLGHFIPHIETSDAADIAVAAKVVASSCLQLDSLVPAADAVTLTHPVGMLIPVAAGKVPKFGIWFRTDRSTNLDFQLRSSSRAGSYTPDQILARKSVEHFHEEDQAGVEEVEQEVAAGTTTKTTTKSTVAKIHYVEVDFEISIEADQYLTLCLLANEHVEVALTDVRMTGVLAVNKKVNHRVSTDSSQNPPTDIGVDAFEFWIPARRPAGKNLAMTFSPAINGFDASNVCGGAERPFKTSNAWVAALDDDEPFLDFSWDTEKHIRRIEVSLDTDFDHPMETVLMRHPEPEIPFCVPEIKVLDSSKNLIGHVENNHSTRQIFSFESLVTKSLRLQFSRRHQNVPVSVFRVRIYED